MRWNGPLAALCVMWALVGTNATASVPLTTPIQGVIRDGAGVPVADAHFGMTFTLYTAPSDPAEEVWSETWPPDAHDCQADNTGCIHVVGGRFNLRLGLMNPLNPEVFSVGPLWLGVAVENEPELPRRPLGTTPFSHRAAAASGLDCTGCVDVDAISDEARQALVDEAVTAVTASGYATGAELNELGGQIADLATAVEELSALSAAGDSELAEAMDALALELEELSALSAEGDTDITAAVDAVSASVEALHGEVAFMQPATSLLSASDQGLIVAANVEISGGLSTSGDLSTDGVVGAGSGVRVGGNLAAECDAQSKGVLQFDQEAQRLVFCDGSKFLQLRACETTCPGPEDVECNEAVLTGCGGDCGETGTALSPALCLNMVSAIPCGGAVQDPCGNDCGSQGTMLDPDACAPTDQVTCGEAILDPCGNTCGIEGSAPNPDLCSPPNTVSCGEPIQDPCGNPCSETGTACPEPSQCFDGVCATLGTIPELAATSCRQILEDEGNKVDGTYWLLLDGQIPEDAFPVHCDMTTDGGGWTLVTVVQDHDASAERKYPVNGMNEQSMSENDQTHWASLSKSRFNALFQTNNDTIMRMHIKKFASLNSGDTNSGPRTYYLKKNNPENFDAFSSIRRVELWGGSDADYKLAYDHGAPGESNLYNAASHNFDHNGKSMKAWTSSDYQVSVDGQSYTIGQHGIPGDAHSNCEWLYDGGADYARICCVTNGGNYAKIWLK